MSPKNKRARGRPIKVATIGYEGADLDGFLRTLKEAGVRRVLDVRAVASSRKPGFSKNGLAEALRRHAIDYVQLRGLGTPKEGRIAHRQNRRDAFERVYAAQLATPDAQGDLARAVELSAERYSCLMCFERDPAVCHRSIVAAEMAKRQAVETVHLMVEI